MKKIIILVLSLCFAMQIQAQSLAKVSKTELTPKQKKQIERVNQFMNVEGILANYEKRGVELTEKQKEEVQVHAIQQGMLAFKEIKQVKEESGELTKEKKNEIRKAYRKTMNKTVKEEVLTQAQRQQLKAFNQKNKKSKK